MATYTNYNRLLHALGISDDNPDSTAVCSCNILDKEQSIREYLGYMFDRTASMFEYSSTPETLIPRMIERNLQMFGLTIIAEVDGSLYSFRARPGGPPDPYYRPTIAIVANPALGLSQEFRIVNHLPPYDKSHWSSLPPCVMIRNDTHLMGLYPMYSRYATQIAENEVSIRSAQINARQQTLISASSQSEIESAEQYQRNLVDGKLATVAETPFIEGIKAQNLGTSAPNTIMQLIELQQYLKAAWFNDIGLNANFNMKREYLSAEEIATNTDILLPLCDDMQACREDGIEWVNKTFGTSISVSKNSAWENKDREVEASIRAEESQTSESSSSSDSELTSSSNSSSSSSKGGDSNA